MSGRTPEQEKHEAQRRIQSAFNLQQYALHAHNASQAMGPVVADAFQQGVERANAELDNSIREYALDHLGMIARELKLEDPADAV